MDLMLRPMSTSQVLDRTFSLYKANFLLFAGIAVLPPALTLGQEVLAFFIREPKTGILDLVGTVLYFVGEAVATGATVYAVSRLHLGNSATIAESYRAVKQLVLRIIGITISIGLMAGLAFVPGAVLMAVFPVVGIPFLVAAAAWATFLLCRYALAVPACVAERTDVGDSLSRSKVLSENYIFRIFLIYFLTALLAATLTAALHIPNYIAEEVHQGTQPVLLQVWEMIATFLGGTLAGPIGTIAIALAYYDNRVRKEAFDLQLMMEAMGRPGAAGATSTAIG